MKILLPIQIRDQLEPRLPADVQAVWVTPEARFEGDPTGAVAYFRWWSGQAALTAVLAAAPHLHWLHTPSAGVEHLLVPELLARDITLTNSAGVHAIPIAEFVMAYLLSRVKNLDGYRSAQNAARWDQHLEPQELYGATMLILGIGGIGQAIAARAAAFGMRVWGSRRTPRSTPYAERVVTGTAWRTLLPEADYVVVAAPLTPESHGMVDAAAFAAMRPSAYLVNIARGPLIDEAALVEALSRGQIAGAALDTFEQEPLPPEHPLWRLPNVLITPHATASSPRMRERQIDLFLENLDLFRNGQPLLNVVDKAAGY